jgi:hypothetical protein
VKIKSRLLITVKASYVPSNYRTGVMCAVGAVFICELEA